MKKQAWNKAKISKIQLRSIKHLFVRQIDMKDIERQTGLTERIIRRVINENKWDCLRDRYLKFLATYSSNNNISLKEISRRSGVNYCALCRIHKKYKTEIPKIQAWNKRINNDIEQNFVRLYNDGFTSQKIAEQYGFKTRKTVLDVLSKHSVDTRPPHVYTYYDEDFFKGIDSHEKAYILGLIMTDGYIIKNYVGFGIQLTETDGYILEKIRNVIGGRSPIMKINCDKKRETLRGARDMARLHVHNSIIAYDLKAIGVTVNKTKTLRYNNCVPLEYESSFFRGLIDGDGTIGFSKNGYPWFCLASASEMFLRDLTSIGSFKWSVGSSKTTTGRIYTLRVLGGRQATYDMYKWLYENKGDLYLRRKYEKVQSSIN